jgi:hypothetical protein
VPRGASSPGTLATASLVQQTISRVAVRAWTWRFDAGRDDDRVAGGELGQGAVDGDRELAGEDGPELLPVEDVERAGDVGVHLHPPEREAPAGPEGRRGERGHGADGGLGATVLGGADGGGHGISSSRSSTTWLSRSYTGLSFFAGSCTMA